MMSKNIDLPSQPSFIDAFMRLEENLSAQNISESTQRIIGHLLVTGRDALVSGDATDDRWAYLIAFAAESSDTGTAYDVVRSIEASLAIYGVPITEDISA